MLADRFRLLSLLGSGGTAEIWRAQDTVLGAEVAVKVLRNSSGQAAIESALRLQNEAVFTRRVRSKHVVEIHELGRDGNVPFLILPVLRGTTLSDRIRAHGGLGFAETRQILGELLHGLAVSHSAGVVHRDVKPHNIFLERLLDSGEELVKLLDFGIAKQCGNQRDDDAGTTRAGRIVGTPAYMAPESRAGAAAIPASDVFAAGMVAYEMITGVRPDPTSARPLHETQRGMDAGVSTAFSVVIARAMHVDPAARYADANEMLEALIASERSAPSALRPGQVIDDRYVVMSTLGEGGSAVVYRARDRRLQRDIALKLIVDVSEGDADAQREQCGRFVDECEILMGIAHQRVVRIHAVGRTLGTAYCVLDLLEGTCLRDASLSWDQLLDVLTQIASALDTIHAAGVIHRDVKAENIIISPAGTATLIDFGVARLGASWRTRTGYILGTPGAEAPEQLGLGEPTSRTDQWGLAALVYHWLSDRGPGAPTTERVPSTEERALQLMENVCAAHIEDIGSLRPDLPREAAAAIDRALSIDPADRYRTVSDFVAALAQTSGHRIAGATRSNHRTRRRRLRRALVVLGVAGVLAVAALASFVGGDQPATAVERLDDKATRRPHPRATPVRQPAVIVPVDAPAKKTKRRRRPARRKHNDTVPSQSRSTARRNANSSSKSDVAKTAMAAEAASHVFKLGAELIKSSPRGGSKGLETRAEDDMAKMEREAAAEMKRMEREALEFERSATP